MLGHEGYRRYDARLPAELGIGNNRLPRHTHGIARSGMFIDKIQDGTVIDHLQPGTLRAVSDALDLENRGYSCTTATIAEKPNPFIKTNLRELPERDLKRIALLSPEPTINAVKDGRVAEKFVYLLCANTNCISRTINEDVPPRFYGDKGTIRCRYCRRPCVVSHRKVTPEERKAYVDSLPSVIEPVGWPE
jgi:aspartate carbamoyltransferase regulatory subunit